MAQHLNSKNISFRQSSLNSPSATTLWNGIQKHFADHVENKLVGENMLSFLTIGNNMVLNFENQKPVLSRKL